MVSVNRDRLIMLLKEDVGVDSPASVTTTRIISHAGLSLNKDLRYASLRANLPYTAAASVSYFLFPTTGP